jgi:hypothetical protein
MQGMVQNQNKSYHTKTKEETNIQILHGPKLPQTTREANT